MTVPYQGVVPYLFVDDAAAAIRWYTANFGFIERGRWTDESGRVQNAEMQAGEAEVWLDGGGRQLFPKPGDDRPQWLGLWVSDVDTVYADLKEKGVAMDPPVTRDFGVRMLNVPDPFGYLWGFICRVET